MFKRYCFSETFLYAILMSDFMISESVTVIIPAYNEEANIKRVVKDTLKVMSSYTRDFEIIVIDDGSVDNTVKIVASIKNKNLKIIRNEKNIGKTKTMLKGFDLAKGEIVSFIDGDYQYDPRSLVALIEKIREGYELCVGNRKKRRDSLYRKFMSFGFNTFDRLMFGIKIKDVNCGLKAFRKKSFRDIRLRYINTGWFIDTELLARYYRKGGKVAEVNIVHYERKDSVSKVSAIKLALETLIYGTLMKFKMVFNHDEK